MIRANSNQVLAVVFALLAIGYLVMAYQIPAFPLPRPVDSDLFPKVLGFMLLGLSLLLFLEKPEQAAPVDEDEPQPAEANQWQRPWTRVSITAVAIAVYALLLNPLGFVLASVILAFGLAWYYGYRNHAVNLAVSLGIVLGLYLTMTRVLDVYLPDGILPF